MSLAHLPHGTFQEFERRHLSQLSELDVRRLIAFPEVWEAMLVTMYEHLLLKLVHRRFYSLEEKFRVIAEWNKEYGLGFRRDHFCDARYQAERITWPTENPFLDAVVVPYLPEKDGVPGYIRTFLFLWQRAREQQDRSWQWNPAYDGELTSKRIRLLEGIEHRPGLRVELIDLGANWDKDSSIAPESVRSSDTSPHAGVLAAAAEDPDWIRQMDGVNVPHVWVPGYELNVPDDGLWQRVSRLSLGDARKLRLNADPPTHCFKGWAVPQFAG